MKRRKLKANRKNLNKKTIQQEVKDEHKKYINNLKKQGKLPDDTEYFDEIRMDLLEKDVIFGGIIYGAGIQFSPPLIFPTIDEYGGEHFVDINSDFLDVEVQIKGDRIYAISDEINSLNDYVDYFNRLIAVFNIIGIPLDFINRSDIIGLIRDVKGKK